MDVFLPQNSTAVFILNKTADRNKKNFLISHRVRERFGERHRKETFRSHCPRCTGARYGRELLNADVSYYNSIIIPIFLEVSTYNK